MGDEPSHIHGCKLARLRSSVRGINSTAILEARRCRWSEGDTKLLDNIEGSDGIKDPGLRTRTAGNKRRHHAFEWSLFTLFTFRGHDSFKGGDCELLGWASCLILCTSKCGGADEINSYVYSDMWNKGLSRCQRAVRVILREH